ncbi:MAG TPA: hypothetical protein VGJ13_08815, partial [Pseudonocardiaceae bacterium]
ADPNGPPTFRPLAGVGAETTQGLMNALSDIITDGSGTKIIASYDNAGSAQITTKDPNVTPGCTINRPNQGGAGTNALVASLQAGNGCVQFARVVTNDSAARPGAGLTYIPFAIDALTYAIRDDSLLPRNLSLANLTAIYNCQVAGVKPLLGTFGAGNRTFFLSKLGLTDAADFVNQPGHTCVKDTNPDGTPLLANDGRVLTDPEQLVTYSSAPYLAQVNGVVPDKHGTAVLGSINGVSPAILNNSSVMSRDVYNVVPTSQLGVTPTSTVFVGPTSQVCSNSATIQRQGFNINPNCGSTAIKTP